MPFDWIGLEMFFSETFGENARREGLPMSAVGETEKTVDPIAVAGLVLSTPGALLATMDLAFHRRGCQCSLK